MVTRFIWPLDDHYITRGFDFVSSIYVMGDNGVRMHAAIDLIRLQGGTLGRDVLAMADGIVVGDAWDMYSGYYIVLEHEGGWRSTYRHLISDAPPVVGHPIMQGQVIGQVGSTGLSSGPHLHADLWHRQPQDPTAHAKVGWWAHDLELYLGQEEDDMFTPEQEAEILAVARDFRIVQGQVNQLIKHGPHYGFGQIADNLPRLNNHLTNVVNGLIAASGGGLKRGDTVKLE